MWQDKWSTYRDLIQEQVTPALGCTEPVSTALACAKAVQLLDQTVERMEVMVSGNLLKNGMGVGIPGTGETGLLIAAALGAVCGDPDKGLEVLDNANPANVAIARQMVDDGRIQLSQVDSPSILYVKVIAYAGKDTATVVIQDYHTNIAFQSLNGKVIASTADTDKPVEEKEKPDLSISAIYEFATQADVEKLTFILKASELNCALSDLGLEQDYGLKIGKVLRDSTVDGLSTRDLMSQAMIRSAAASDARMGGAMLPAMSNSGSGNQGIAATMPVVAVANCIGAQESQLVRALIMSHLIAIHIKSHMHVLSAFCAATTAAVGASAAITWLMGGGEKEVESAIFNIFGDVTGVLCDGAGSGCSLKVSTSAQAAVKSAIMAMNGVRITSHEGIIEDSVESTIDNIGHIANDGLANADKLIIKIMST